MTEVCRNCNACQVVLKTETLKSEQSEALEALISGREVIVIMPTEFGKSLYISRLFSLAPSVKRERLFVVYIHGCLDDL